MENFNVEAARQIVGSLQSDELHNILLDIKMKAEKGETVLHLKERLTTKTINILKLKGFKVITYPQIMSQKNNLCHSIYWDYKQ